MNTTISKGIKKSKRGSPEDFKRNKNLVELYDSSLIYSFNSLARIFSITPQRAQALHAEFEHDCPRKKLKKGLV